MLLSLTPLQARIIGVLLEKESTTPDQYPLSLNGLTLGCNQKSNREPVMNLTEQEVQQGLDELHDKKSDQLSTCEISRNSDLFLAFYIVFVCYQFIHAWNDNQVQ